MAGFICFHCSQEVWVNNQMGTHYRNHCPYCLWSKHILLCGGEMEPLGLTTKQIAPDKWGKERVGELMLIHKCIKCDKVSINRLASDDIPEEIIKIFEKSQGLDENTKQELQDQSIKLLNIKDKTMVTTQLWGK